MCQSVTKDSSLPRSGLGMQNHLKFLKEIKEVLPHHHHRSPQSCEHQSLVHRKADFCKVTNLEFTSFGFLWVILADASRVFCITALKQGFYKGTQDYAGTSLTGSVAMSFTQTDFRLLFLLAKASISSNPSAGSLPLIGHWPSWRHQTAKKSKQTSKCFFSVASIVSLWSAISVWPAEFSLSCFSSGPWLLLWLRPLSSSSSSCTDIYRLPT